MSESKNGLNYSGDSGKNLKIVMPDDSSLEMPLEALPGNVTRPDERNVRKKIPRSINFKKIYILNFAIILLLIAVGAGAILLTRHKAASPAQQNDSIAKYKNSQETLKKTPTDSLLPIGQAETLTINGKVSVNNTLVLNPTKTPSAPTAGQLYYNQNTNTPYYYNGTSFVSLAPQPVSPSSGAGAKTSVGVTDIEGISGSIGLNSELAINGGVLGLNLQSGSGIDISNNTISNTGVVSLIPGTSNITITNDGNGVYAIGDQLVGVITGGGSGAAGSIPFFDTDQSLQASYLSQGSNLITDSQALTVDGAIQGASISVSGAAASKTLSVASGDFGVDDTGAVTAGTYNGDNLTSSELLFNNAGSDYIDTATGEALNIGTAYAGSIVIGNSSSNTQTITLGNNTSIDGTLTVGNIAQQAGATLSIGNPQGVTVGGNTTYGVTDIYSDGSEYTLPGGGGTICTTESGCAIGQGDAVILGATTCGVSPDVTPCAQPADNDNAIWVWDNTSGSNLIRLDGGTTETQAFEVQNNGDTFVDGNLTVGTNGTDIDPGTAGTLVLQDATSSDSVSLESPSLTDGSLTFTLPSSYGQAGNCLEAPALEQDGVQALSFGACIDASGVTAVGNLDTSGYDTSSNGATINGDTIYLQSATASVPGLVNTSSQDFAGDKTFEGVTSGADEGTTALTVSGGPTSSNSYVQFGNTFGTGSGSAANTVDGTYLGINEPGSGNDGYGADFINLQDNGTSVLNVTSAGNLNLYSAPASQVGLEELGSALGTGTGSSNSSANEGTYIGINEPQVSGVNSTANFVNFQNNGTSELAVNSTGNVNAAGNISIGGNINLGTTIPDDGYVSTQETVGSGGVNAGDVVILNSSGQVVDTTTARDTRVYGVATQGSLTAGNPVNVAISGNYVVNATSAPISVGDQLVTSTTSGAVMTDNSATSGIIGIALSSKGSGVGTVDVVIRPVSGQSSVIFSPQPGLDSTTAFQIQNANRTSTILDADTTDNFIGIDTSAPTQTLTLGSGNQNFLVASPTSVSAIATHGVGGSISSGTQYYYKVTALTSAGGETSINAATEVSALVSSPNNEVIISWSPVSGADGGYRIYRGTSSNAENKYFQVPAGTYTYTDTGSSGTGGLGNSANTASSIFFNSSGGNSYIDSGNFGIGTSSPSSLLTVSGNTNKALTVVNSSTGVSVLNVNTQSDTVTTQAGTDNSTLGAQLFNCSAYNNNSPSCWQSPTTNWSFTSSSATAGSSAAPLSPTTTVLANPTSTNYYSISYTISGPVTAGATLNVTFGGNTVGAYTFSGNTVTDSFTETKEVQANSTAGLIFTPSSTFNGTVLGISVQQVTTNTSPNLVVNNASGVDNIEVRASNSTSNAFIGLNAGLSNNVNTLQNAGLNNLAVGTDALEYNVSGSNNTALGYNALQNNTGNYNVPNVGNNNTAVGSSTLQGNTSGYNNTALGYQALDLNTTGHDSLALGVDALQDNTIGYENLALGTNTLQLNTTGSQSIAIGYNSLSSNTSGSTNVSIGQQALQYSSSANNNVALGYKAGVTSVTNNKTTTGSNNTFVGNETGQGESTYQISGSTAIGNLSTVNQSNTIILGCTAGQNSCSTTTNVGIGSQYAPNLLSVASQTYGTYSANGSGTTITQSNSPTLGQVTINSGTTNPAMVGGYLYYPDGTMAQIISVSGNTLISSNTTETPSNAQYEIVYGGFNINSAGSVFLQPASTAESALQIQENPLGTSSSLLQLGSVLGTGTGSLYQSAGTYLGINAPSGSSADLLNLQVNGVSMLEVTSAGAINAATSLKVGTSSIAGSVTIVGAGGSSNGVELTAPSNITTSGINLVLPTNVSPKNTTWATGQCLTLDTLSGTTASLGFESCTGGPGDSAVILNDDPAGGGAALQVQPGSAFWIQGSNYSFGDIIDEGANTSNTGLNYADLLMLQDNTGITQAAFNFNGSLLSLDDAAGASSYSSGLVYQVGTDVIGLDTEFTPSMNDAVIHYLDGSNGGNGTYAVTTYGNVTSPSPGSTTNLTSNITYNSPIYNTGTVSQGTSPIAESTTVTLSGGTVSASWAGWSFYDYSSKVVNTITSVNTGSNTFTTSTSNYIPAGTVFIIAPPYSISSSFPAALTIGNSSDSTNSSGGINLGGDTQIYRSGSGTINFQSTTNINSTAPSQIVTLQAAPNAGYDVQGATMAILAGAGTGTADGGNLVLQVAPPPNADFIPFLATTPNKIEGITADSLSVWFADSNGSGSQNYIGQAKPNGVIESAEAISTGTTPTSNYTDCGGYVYFARGSNIGRFQYSTTTGNYIGGTYNGSFVSLPAVANTLTCYEDSSGLYHIFWSTSNNSYPGDIYQVTTNAAGSSITDTLFLDDDQRYGVNTQGVDTLNDNDGITGVKVSDSTNSPAYLYWINNYQVSNSPSSGNKNYTIVGRACISSTSCPPSISPPQIDSGFAIDITSRGNPQDMAVTPGAVYVAYTLSNSICYVLLAAGNTQSCNDFVGPGSQNIASPTVAPDSLALNATDSILYWASAETGSNTAGSIGEVNLGGTTVNTPINALTISGVNGAATFQSSVNSSNDFQVLASTTNNSYSIFNINSLQAITSVVGQLSIQGGISTSGLAAPSAPTAVSNQSCSSGCTTYEYAISAVNGNNQSGPVVTSNTITSSTSLTAGPPAVSNTITWQGSPGAASYNVYRYSIGSGGTLTTGLIGNVAANSLPSGYTFTDSGQSTTGSIIPTTDSTGSLNVTNGSLNVAGSAFFQNATNSTTAFQIQDSGSSGGILFDADTFDNSNGYGYIGIGTAVPKNLLSIGVLTTADSLAQLAIGTVATTNKGIVVQAVASQTADLLDVENSGGNVIFGISATGHIITGSQAGSYTTTLYASNGGTGETCSAVGNDNAGLITINTGTSGTPAAGEMCSFSYNSPYNSSGVTGAVPRVVITPTGSCSASCTSLASTVEAYVIPNTSTFQIYFNLPPSLNSAYTFDWFSPQ